MSPTPILKVLSIFRKNRVRALLMGGQACIVYGAAQFSRDVDLVVLASPSNLDRLKQALAELRAEPEYFPELSQEVLLRGHACHFRAHTADIEDLRIDIMSVLHGCGAFDQLWKRRNKVRTPGSERVDLLSLPDLVRAKKTQRDKDWLMVRRLIENDYDRRPARPARSRITFWLREACTASLLIELCRRYPGTARQVALLRPAVAVAISGPSELVETALRQEEDQIRAADRIYWQPLRAELTQMRYAWIRARRLK